MKTRLYDEDRWPSGTAGGKVTVKKENRIKYITMYIDEEISTNVDVVFKCECNAHDISYSDDGISNML